MLSHSKWAFGHNIDRYSIDCAGWGKSQRGYLYQRFHCTMDDEYLPFSYLYLLTVTGRDRFAMTLLQRKVRLGP